MPGQIKIDDGAGNYTILTSPTSLGSDKTFTLASPVLQVVSASDATVASYTIAADASQKLGSLEVSITPSSTSSKILLMATVNTNAQRYNSLNFFRDSTVLGMSTAATGNQTNIGVYLNGGAFTGITFQMLSTAMQYVDSPSSTSSITYSVQVTRRYLSDDVFYNRPEDNTDAAYIVRGVSHIVAMEIGG